MKEHFDLQRIYPEAELAVHTLDGKPLAHQAAFFSNASLVIQAHGAALGRLLLLSFYLPFNQGFILAFELASYVFRSIDFSILDFDSKACEQALQSCE